MGGEVTFIGDSKLTKEAKPAGAQFDFPNASSFFLPFLIFSRLLFYPSS